MTPPAARQADAHHVPLSHRLLHLAMQAGVLAGLWALAFVVLLVLGQKPREAVGFATVIAIVGSFFTRSLVPHLADKKQAAPAPAPHHPTDSVREVIETIVFVVVLVLLLKSFVAEAFVIPTGSMAQTLWGYQKVVTCPQCGLEFPVNCSGEVDPQEGQPRKRVEFCACPNCRLPIHLYEPGRRDPNQLERAANIRDPGWHSGDRVLVAKYVYDLLGGRPDRLDVVVFKFPGNSSDSGGNDPGAFPYSGPVKKHVPINYIKRLIGLPGETIAIYRGKLYVLSAEKGPQFDDANGKLQVNWKVPALHLGHDDTRKLTLWQFPHMHKNESVGLFKVGEGDFDMIRKSPGNMLSVRRLVNDHDHQAADLADDPRFRRWVGEDNSGWAAAGRTGFRHDGSTAGAGQEGYGWLRYRHVLRRGAPPGPNEKVEPELITDFMGYNTNDGPDASGQNWASDLMVECEVTVEQAAGQFALELSRGPDRFQAVFNLETGACTLHRLPAGKKPVELETGSDCIKGKGTYLVRLANFDDRLTLWVDERMPFKDGKSYDPVARLAPTRENDLEPVSIGASSGAVVRVGKLKVYRDTYYTAMANTRNPNQPDVDGFRPADPSTWKGYEHAPVATYYVQPGHYLCMGDNSPQSSDGRSWGLVPQRLLLGRAVMVYYPFSRTGRIR